ncbi:hypothetical protein HYW53_01065 [Candidatus Giovannonibacteria bacterium]|nr:hypothetical protein [Candidatus Giovannonibacteria bacterium]
MIKRLPKSSRKFIRFEKSRIRGQFSDLGIRREKISELYARFAKKVKNPPAESPKPTEEDRKTISRKQIKASSSAKK